MKKWPNIFIISCICFFISVCCFAFKNTFFPLTLILITFSSMAMSLAFWITESIISKRKRTTIYKFKAYSIATAITWGFFIAYIITILAYTVATNKITSGMIFVTCSYFLPVAFVIWFYQCTYYISLIKKYHGKSELWVFSVKLTRSILIALNSWLLLILGLSNLKQGFLQLLNYAYIIFSTASLLFYPMVDMFEYTYSIIDKYEKDKQNESNGSIN